MKKQINRSRNRLACSIRSILMLFVMGGAAFTVPALSFAQEAKELRYTVRWGDTLAKLARRFYGDWKAFPLIADANHLKDPHFIVSGSVLVIPAAIPAAPSLFTPPPAEDIVTSSSSTANEAVLSSSTSVTVPDAIASTLEPFAWRKESNSAFGAGEKLEYVVRWQFVGVGNATLEIHGTEEIDGRQAYHIYSSARSSDFFDNFYKVRDTNESWMDTESLCSLKFASRISECGHDRNETVVLDHEKKQFKIEESGKTGDAAQWAQDVLSSLYYLRTRELEVGREYLIDAHSGDKSWPLKVRVLKREKVKVPAGEFDCFVVEPAIRDGAGIFQSKGSLLVWMTADSKRIPVLMRSKIAVGAIEAQLKSLKTD